MGVGAVAGPVTVIDTAPVEEGQAGYVLSMLVKGETA